MDKLKRVCFFCERWESGGIEAFLCQVILHLDAAKYTVYIVCSEIRESMFTQKLEAWGVTFRELSGSQKKLSINHRMFRSLLKQEHFDVVYINAFQSLSMWYAYLAEREKVPIRIVHSHNTALRNSRTKQLKLLLHDFGKRFLSKHATAFAACSEAAARFMFPSEMLQQVGYTFIPNGIKTQSFRFDAQVRSELRKSNSLEGRFVIGNVGRLCYQKNQTFLIEVMPYVLEKYPEAVLLLIGDGDALPELKEKARRLGVEKNVRFLGAVEHVERWLWAMDVFAFPSRFEGLGIAAVEAQAAGLPTIVSPHVPKEAQVTDLVQTINLDLTQWGQAAAKAGVEESQRAAYSAAVRRAGFDITNTVNIIEELICAKNDD